MTKDQYLIKLSESPKTNFGKVDYAEQPNDQKIFSTIWALESQVNNGGFLQYFASDDGETANDAPDALRAIGAETCAKIVEVALRDASSVPLPESQEAREELVENLSEEITGKFDVLDEAFMMYPDDLSGLLFTFVAARPQEFGEVPQDLED